MSPLLGGREPLGPAVPWPGRSHPVLPLEVAAHPSAVPRPQLLSKLQLSPISGFSVRGWVQVKINNNISKSFCIYPGARLLRFKSWLKWVLVSSRLTPPWLCFLDCEMGMMVTWLLRRLNVLTKGSGQSNHPLNIGHLIVLFRCTLAYLHPLAVLFIIRLWPG